MKIQEVWPEIITAKDDGRLIDLMSGYELASGEIDDDDDDDHGLTELLVDLYTLRRDINRRLANRSRQNDVPDHELMRMNAILQLNIQSVEQERDRCP